jgi:perosamine synthetase
MTNICAAIGLAQLEQANFILAAKRQLAEYYRELLIGLPLEFHAQEPKTVHSYWMVSVAVHDPRDRDLLRDHLKAASIETRPVFYPVHTMPMYSSVYERHPVAESIGWRGINLPSYPALTIGDVRFISEKIRQYFNEKQADR